MSTTAREIELKRQALEARLALPNFLLRRSMSKVAAKIGFRVYDESMPDLEPSVEVLRSVAYHHKRTMTERIRWERWSSIDVKIET